jgi:hypothetical protein
VVAEDEEAGSIDPGCGEKCEGGTRDRIFIPQPLGTGWKGDPVPKEALGTG